METMTFSLSRDDGGLARKKTQQKWVLRSLNLLSRPQMEIFGKYRRDYLARPGATKRDVILSVGLVMRPTKIS
jgi:hypothetical protein